MTKAIRIHETGGPEVLKWEDVEVGQPGPGEIRLRHTAIGLNFLDTYVRIGLYPVKEFPAILGGEAAAVIEELSPDVEGLEVGQRIAYAGGSMGSYCEERLFPAALAIPLPDAIPDQTAAAMMLKGMTSHYLIRSIYRVGPGDTILIHAAAGGVGLIVCQWAKHLGATVIGTVGSAEKAELAASHGCDHPINYRTENFTERVMEITDGKGLPVVYDSIGKDTFEASLNCLRKRGIMVTFGNASGPVPPFAPAILNAKGSLMVTRPTLAHFVETREELLSTAQDLFDVVEAGHVKIKINQTQELRNTAQAHADLEARKTTGSTVLLP